jgi:hypothetical protein
MGNQRSGKNESVLWDLGPAKDFGSNSEGLELEAWYYPIVAF